MEIEKLKSQENIENNFENREFKENQIEEKVNREIEDNKKENQIEKELISLKYKNQIEKQEQINDILEYGLLENYSKLSEEKKKEFKKEGEKLILEIVFMIDKNIEETFIESPDKILEKIKNWLISGFGDNPYSIQQSKIVFDNLKNKFYK
jgi:hypothetical protein